MTAHPTAPTSPKQPDGQSLAGASGSVPTTMLPPLPKKEVLHAPERREIRGYTAAQMMDYAEAAVAATWKAQKTETRRP